MATDRKRAALVARPKPGDEIEVEISKLTMPFFVRHKLDEDWALQLAELLEAGVKLTPITVYPVAGNGYAVRDGRHRIEAHKLCSKATILATVVHPAKDMATEISLAYNANAGGALPPSREDMTHTVSLLLSQGLKPNAIAQLIPTFPPSMVRKYVNGIYNREKFARLREAAGAVADGEMTAPQAAEKYGCDLDQLRKELGGKKKASVARAAEQVSGIKRNHASVSQKNAAMMKRQIEGFEDGEITAHQLDVVVEALIQSAKRVYVSAQGWLPRIAEAKSRRTRLANVREED